MKRGTLAERFWSKVIRGTPEECWLWSSSDIDKDGYGKIGSGIGGRFKQHMQLKAHRVAWELAHTNPGSMWVLHKCNNRLCVNPLHLYLGDHLDNMDDVIRAGSQRGERNPQAVLTDIQCTEIRFKRASGTLLYILATEYGVSKATISRICTGVRRALAT